MPATCGRRKKKTRPLTEAQKAVVAANRGLIGVAAKGLFLKNMSTYDMDQEGTIALANAARGFKPKKGLKFSTYATAAIKNTLKRRDQEYELIHVPHYLRTEKAQNHRYQKHAKAVDGRISVDEAAESGWSPTSPEDEETEFGYQAMRAVSWAVRKLSLDERRVIRGLVMRGESARRVGDQYGLTNGQVKKIKMQAFAKLRASLQKHV